MACSMLYVRIYVHAMCIAICVESPLVTRKKKIRSDTCTLYFKIAPLAQVVAATLTRNR